MSTVCFQCFSDMAIVEYIQRNGSMGHRCKYCGENSSLTISSSHISTLLEPILDTLELNEYGATLEEILTKEVEVISSKCQKVDKLLIDIFGSAHPDKRYSFKGIGNQSEEWKEFKEELIFRNRFFPEKALSGEIFSMSGKGSDAQLFVSFISTLLRTIDTGEIFYRARISDSDLVSGEMGRPPREKASSGRANPAGIAYLYVADDLETAIKEVRPHTGSAVYVSEVKAINDVTVLDLSMPKKLASVLKFNEEDIASIVRFLKILDLFSVDLSKPVLPDKSHLEYVPTQYFCEYVKTLKESRHGGAATRIFDGILFQSSLSNGSNNIVLFDDSKFQVGEPNKYYVKSNTLNFEKS